MKLNPDCVRSILLAVEALSINEYYTVKELCEKIPQHSVDDIRYNVVKLHEAGYLIADVWGDLPPVPGVYGVYDITFSGHEFLNSIRSDTNWAKIKSVAKKVGAVSLKTIGQIAQTVIATAVTAVLQSNQ